MKKNLGNFLLFGAIGLFCSCTKPKLDPISPQLQAEINYGRELIAHTAKYLGPKGIVAPQNKSRMNCQNCHLDAGTKPYGISFETTFTRYPEYRAREAKIITLEDRINNCFERPMNGRALPPESREMRALMAYYRYLSRGKVVGERRFGDNLNDVIELPKRAANPKKGKHIYESKCASCHGENGLGKLNEAKSEFIYPPLWGPESFNEASNMHRVIKLAAFIKANMPLGATVDKPLLTDEEAFDVSAFINDPKLHLRPRSRWKDYPEVAEKPIDYPFGPYVDGIPEIQHRLGPYPPILKKLKELNIKGYF